jgi:hypothetical protein
MMDYSKLMFPKPEPKRREVRRKRMDKAQFQREQRAKVMARSQGRCEIWELGSRCGFRADEVHHLIGGHGKRNVGKSALAAYQIGICREHHRDIHNGLGYVRSLDEDDPTRRIIFVRRSGTE